MKPRFYFTLKTALFIVGIILASLFAVYLLSLAIFIIKANGIWYFPKIQGLGILTMIKFAPWLIIISAIVMIIILEIFAKNFNFIYRRPMLYSILAIISIIIISSFAVNQIRIHPRIFQKAQEHRLPFIEKTYRRFGAPNIKNIHRGIIIKIKNKNFEIKNKDSKIIQVITTPQTKIPQKPNLKINDAVIVFGKLNSGRIKALGVIKTEKAFLGPHHLPAGPPLHMKKW